MKHPGCEVGPCAFPREGANPKPNTFNSDLVDQEEEDQGPPSPRADSEAETIIQSGRESLSPEKKRKHIRHDPLRQAVNGVDAAQRKKPRLGDRGPSGSRSPSPGQVRSPSSVVKIEKVEDLPSVTRAALDETSVNQGDKPRIYRKRSFSDSVEDKGDRQRGSNPMNDIPNLKRVNAQSQQSTRSVSPNRSHQRSSSGSQINSKKKAPTPLLTGGYQRQVSEDRQSTSSSASSSPLPSNHLRRLGSGAGASASPAKHMGPKKLRDKSGRTPLARACADRKHDQVMARHSERPEDLNVPDNAGNTPLQIASLNGEASIVKFLLDAGCEINTKNIDKDTPLIDAVENGHVEVVKLLLDAGANPRTVNASGDEPYELVPQELKEEKEEDYEEIRKALADAKSNQRPGGRSEERIGSDSKATSSRRASGATPPPLSGAASRRKTGRSEATRNDLLWTQPTPENLMNFAAKGDEQGVVSILNVLQKADNASLIAAAKGGHGDVLSLMYAIGNADADPNPLRGAGHKAGYNTPMLAAIGRGNTAVIELILSQPGFNPTRRLFEDRTYYELSRARQGENWEQEYDLLKSAYEKYSNEKGRKGHSSPRRARTKVKDDERHRRRESSSPVDRPPKKLKESPTSKPHSQSSQPLSRSRPNEDHPRPRSSKDQRSNAVPTSDHDSNHPDSMKPKSSSARRGSESRGGESRGTEWSGTSRPDETRKRRLIAGRRPQEHDRRPNSFSGREESSKATDSSLKRIRADTSPERSRSRGPDQDRLSPESRKKKRRILTEEKVSNMSNGSPPNAHDSIDGEKAKSHHPQEDHHPPESPAMRSKSTDGPKKPASPKPSAGDTNKRVGATETESLDHESLDNGPAEVVSAEKQAEAEAEKRRQAHAKKVEEDRLAEEKRAEEEAERARLAKEEAERTARVAREKAEEEERKRKEVEQRRAKQAEDERQKRVEQERARIMKVHREQEAQEQRRRDALPGRLRTSANLIGSNDPYGKSRQWLEKFTPLVTAFTRQLEPNCAPDVAEEKWIPNYLAAPLLGTNDLQLSQYASWEKRKATPTQRNNLWRCTRRHLVPSEEIRYRNATFGQIMQLDSETRPKYFGMEHVFWIKLYDFMDLVPHIPHLHTLKLDDFMSMHIDPEPDSLPPVQTNGRHTPVLDSFPEPHTPGASNGHNYSRPGTYF
ncbi:hypothetical protein N7468_001113 [Penicillium chermesinum]|uniref:Ankyrin repeat protein n=1 Tax=Penicillium chermesinum TaxID=63820 RepID=A0A9W9TWH1_9EURO|nr:uncharacterized protein N7468_001113 [Penicillium chermesinum]KAJ5246130.1 hypothetical protein N7468_001113 [Penicillium chermesinum]